MLQDPASVLRPVLSQRETLLWCGQPRQGFLLRPSDVLMIPFSLFWGGFAIFWESLALGIFFGETSSGDSAPLAVRLLFPLFGLPFVLVGLYLIFGRFWHDKLLRERTYYGVTDERVLIKSGLLFPTLKSLSLRNLSNISLTEKADGSGSISFGAGPLLSWPFSLMPSWHGMPSLQGWVFDSIRDAGAVYAVLQAARAKM